MHKINVKIKFINYFIKFVYQIEFKYVASSLTNFKVETHLLDLSIK